MSAILGVAVSETETGAENMELSESLLETGVPTSTDVDVDVGADVIGAAEAAVGTNDDESAKTGTETIKLTGVTELTAATNEKAPETAQERMD
ncbi:hypothetical protein [Sutterella sp.]|uniref:hypothetical protein n=1 Tax=Sutterella sp. TaxID=1981025 RepID=UPI003FD88DFB